TVGRGFESLLRLFHGHVPLVTCLGVRPQDETLADRNEKRPAQRGAFLAKERGGARRRVQAPGRSRVPAPPAGMPRAPASAATRATAGGTSWRRPAASSSPAGGLLGRSSRRSGPPRPGRCPSPSCPGSASTRTLRTRRP